MASTATTQPRQQPRISQGSKGDELYNESLVSKEVYELPLRPVSFSKIIPSHQPSLNENGWSTLTLTQSDHLYKSSQALFQAGQSFFNQSTEHKSKYKTKTGTDEGWNHVDGEKEFITLRNTSLTPPELLHAAKEFWSVAGDILHEILGQIAKSLGMDEELLTRYSKPCIKMRDQNTATMVRLFRYEGEHGKVVSEKHRDLGLLSLSISDKPGLEVLDRYSNRWFPIEQSYEGRPAGTLMVGRELEALSNGRFVAGGHLVRGYTDRNGLENRDEKSYRSSLVFVLRAHEAMTIDTDELRTPITGPWKEPMKAMNIGELWRRISKAHININSDMVTREEQRAKLAQHKVMMSEKFE